MEDTKRIYVEVEERVDGTAEDFAKEFEETKERVTHTSQEVSELIALDQSHIHYGVANDTLDDIEIFVTRIVRYQDW